jgi:hypothetical protein
MSKFARTLAVLLILLLAVPARALFHIAVIDEVMCGATGNPNLQHVAADGAVRCRSRELRLQLPAVLVSMRMSLRVWEA